METIFRPRCHVLELLSHFQIFQPDSFIEWVLEISHQFPISVLPPFITYVKPSESTNRETDRLRSPFRYKGTCCY